jgi:hypothetical protein
MLNHHLSQELKLIERGKFNHLINTLTLAITGEVQYVEYLIEIEGK